ncbi:hypothetical protein GCM10008107_26900 [Psychrosphaera saromensis]|nr:hypothetical protein GCM10008107_26900 [Psychrosphaera saromensis]GLQ14507.1 hypothetical protein GCM10007917_19620 [Psychrosphaera saromensis]
MIPCSTLSVTLLNAMTEDTAKMIDKAIMVNSPRPSSLMNNRHAILSQVKKAPEDFVLDI